MTTALSPLLLATILVFALVGCAEDEKNEAPTASDLSVSTLSGSPVSGRVLGFDRDGSIERWYIAVAPLRGNITFDTVTGEFTYTPTFDFVGTDTWQVRAQDDSGNLSAPATVTIEVIGSSNS